MEHPPTAPPPPTGLPVEGVAAPPTAAAPTRGPRAWPWWLGLASLLVAFIGASIFVAIVVGIGSAFGYSTSDPPPGVQIVGVLLQDACFLGFPLLLAANFGGIAPWMFGVRKPRIKLAVACVVIGYVALLVFSAVWTQIVHFKDDSALVDDLGVRSSTLAMIAGAFIICVVAPIAEETLFRGFLFPTLRNIVGTVGGALTTGLVFGLIHAGSAPVGALVPLGVFGAILCVIYLRTQSLLPCMSLHCLNNVIAYGTLVKWDWQIPVCLVASLGLIWLAYRAVDARISGPGPLPEPL